jgi:TMEM175 potassium channel family protein
VSTNRLEAFSDGVIAVAITLLVLGITVPAGGRGTLSHALLERWPEYAAYVVSFLTIGIIWINHHVMIGRLREADHVILILNLVLLMTIGILPFATDLMAHYLRRSEGQSLAAAVYAGCFGLMAIAFGTLNRHLLIDKAHLLKVEMALDQRKLILRRSTLGLVPYVVATGFAFVSPYLTLAICGALALFYALPLASGE